jgi:hypothetical protein
MEDRTPACCEQYKAFVLKARLCSDSGNAKMLAVVRQKVYLTCAHFDRSYTNGNIGLAGKTVR